MDALKLMAEYGGTVLWHFGGAEVGPVDPRSLGLSQHLRDSIAEWAIAYDATFNQEYPPNSSFPSQEAEAAFEAEGRRIWHELQKELNGRYRVLYFSEVDQRLLE